MERAESHFGHSCFIVILPGTKNPLVVFFSQHTFPQKRSPENYSRTGGATKAAQMFDGKVDYSKVIQKFYGRKYGQFTLNTSRSVAVWRLLSLAPNVKGISARHLISQNQNFA